MFVPPIDMRVTFPRVELSLTWPKTEIDPTAAHGDIGLKQIGPLMKEVASSAQAAGQQAIAAKAREGDRLARVEESANAIAEIAAEKWSPSKELNVDVAPKNRPQIKSEPGQLSLQLHPGRVSVSLPHLFGPGQRLDVRA